MSDFLNPEPVIIEPDALEPVVVMEEALDLQHDTDPEEDHSPAKRIPHLGHALLFFSLALMCVSGAAIAVFALFRPRGDENLNAHPGLSLLALGLGYVLLLAAAWNLFPRLWERSFLHGIQWNILAAHRRWFWIVPFGICVSVLAQFSDRFVSLPDKDPLEALMRTPFGAWSVTLFGIFLAPLVEEIAFRGFLLPALATAYDWLALERTRQGLRRWENTSAHTTTAVLFGAIFSSVPFALLHSGQLQHAWGAVSVIFGVSLALSFVRIRTHSVACSTLMHATYNATIFVVALVATGGYRHLDKL